MRKNGKELEIPNLHGKIPTNKTTRFLLPTLEFREEKINYKYLKEYGLINAYIGYEEDYMNFKNSLFLLFNPSLNKLSNWHQFYEFYSTERKFMGEYDLDINIVLLIFSLPLKYSQYPAYLIGGKYSKFSLEYAKKFVISQEGNKIKALPEYLIITKSPERKKFLEDLLGVEIDQNMEYEDMPNKSEEILSLEFIKNLAK